MEKKIVKRYTLVQIIEHESKDKTILKGELYFGNIDGYSDCLNYPQTIFDTEEEAIESIKKNELYGNWIVVPVYSYEYV